jgi:hypothetical protein
MVITVSPELETALNKAAQQQGTTPEAVALAALRERFLPAAYDFEPRDEWERTLLSIGRARGVALSNKAISSEGIYD